MRPSSRRPRQPRPTRPPARMLVAPQAQAHVALKGLAGGASQNERMPWATAHMHGLNSPKPGWHI
eukprot:15166952-Alexandrium_andersonii.AAC.1